MPRPLPVGLFACLLVTSTLTAADKKPSPAQIEFFEKKIRPVLVKQCYSCHSAKAKILRGGLRLDNRQAVARGGETGPAVLPGKPAESLVLEYISGDDPAMPLGADPLDPQQVDLISRWIAQGARDDTPPAVQDDISAENPPRYASAPVITALDYSPDSKLLAISGYREILLHAADGSGLQARLVGRILQTTEHDVPWWRVVNAAGRLVPGHEAEQVTASAQEFDPEARVVIQSEQLGTAHAVLQAGPELEGFDGDAIVRDATWADLARTTVLYNLPEPHWLVKDYLTGSFLKTHS